MTQTSKTRTVTSTRMTRNEAKIVLCRMFAASAEDAETLLDDAVNYGGAWYGNRIIRARHSDLSDRYYIRYTFIAEP